MPDTCNICKKPLSKHRDGLACCPFCGSHAEMEEDEWGYDSAFCSQPYNCRLSSCYREKEETRSASPEEAREAWNRRAETHAERELAELQRLREGIAIIEEMHATPGSMELRLKENPALAEWILHCLASLVADSPNYTEAKFEQHASGCPEWITVTVKKGTGKTPHQLRAEAERELSAARERIAELEEALRRHRKLVDQMYTMIHNLCHECDCDAMTGKCIHRQGLDLCERSIEELPA